MICYDRQKRETIQELKKNGFDRTFTLELKIHEIESCLDYVKAFMSWNEKNRAHRMLLCGVAPLRSTSATLRSGSATKHERHRKRKKSKRQIKKIAQWLLPTAISGGYIVLLLSCLAPFLSPFLFRLHRKYEELVREISLRLRSWSGRGRTWNVQDKRSSM